ncbi:hypothetical protein DL764_006761 [Monosporascus ibericus]|uniref:Zeta toxin domain-containing protein n=1 Tax=Monosporascus ibericus TaxID=155417 RepID=A0A4Q4T767_9PEZI|nr:hypothetical protein DL764_006761 [Monosporascus ibericus]
MNADIKSYILSDSEARTIFEEKILPAEFGNFADRSHREGTRQPLAVFVIGQTGAGKTRTAPALKAAMTELRGGGGGEKPPAHFIADTYKTYHPAYAELAAGDKPALASAAAGPDARRWLAMAAAHAASRRMDVLLESACRHPGDFADLARAFRAAGYRVEVCLMAVPRALSLLGVLVRFHERLPEAGLRWGLPVRLTPRRVHDDSYAGVLDAAAFVDSSDAVDQVVVVRRGNLVAYADERGPDGRWSRAGGVANAVLAERRRPLTEVERSTATADLQMLRAMDIVDISAQLEEIEALLRSVSGGSSDGSGFPPLRVWQLSRKDASYGLNKNPSLGLGT